MADVFKQLRLAAEAQGFKVTKTGSDHWKFVPPNTKAKIVIVASTPSDHRAILNVVTMLRRSGFNDGVHAVRHG